MHSCYLFGQRKRFKKDINFLVVFFPSIFMSLFKIAEYLMRIKGINILRVYGNFIEQKRFPIPNQIQPTRPIASEQELRIPKNLRRIALHYVIRDEETSPYANKLRRLESLFAAKKKKKEKVEEVLVEEYLAVRTHQCSRYRYRYELLVIKANFNTDTLNDLPVWLLTSVYC